MLECHFREKFTKRISDAKQMQNSSQVFRSSWVSNKSFVPSEGRRFGSNSGGFERERKVGFGSSGGADFDNWNKKKGEINIGSEKSKRSEGVGGGRLRLVLQPRSLSVSNESQEGGGFVNVAKPKGPNLFGEARPRE
ncbi:hypothetical protein RJT34_29954 [Clitoria ternatea]|uniref:Uncharacterized protein n=1 Tax=Clitoria ternatea TaxID=43366 RepID=A0AAN9ERI1_CLITE